MRDTNEPSTQSAQLERRRVEVGPSAMTVRRATAQDAADLAAVDVAISQVADRDDGPPGRLDDHPVKTWTESWGPCSPRRRRAHGRVARLRRDLQLPA